MSNIAPQRDHMLLGILYMVGYTIMFSLVSLFVKLASPVHDPIEIMFWRSFVMIILLFLWLAATKRLFLLKKAQPKAQIIRGTIGTIAMLFTFYAFALLPLAEAHSLLFTAPLFVVMLSYPLLREKVGPYRTAAALIGFTGVILILQPGTISSLYGGFITMTAALGHAIVFLCLRWLGRTEDPIVTVFYFSLISLIIVLPVMPFIWTMPTPETVFYLLLTGIAALFTQIFLTRSNFLAPSSAVAPITYLNLLWATLFDILIWHQNPSGFIFIGGAIIIISNLFILWRERKKNVSNS